MKKQIKSQAEYCRLWRKNNPEKAKASHEQWILANPVRYKANAARRMRRWRESNPEKARLSAVKSARLARQRYPELIKERKLRAFRKHMYNLDHEDYQLLFLSQNKKCAICQISLKIGHVDHCHKTRKIRGLLCRKCNSGLGMFKDSMQTLDRAIIYLRTS